MIDFENSRCSFRKPHPQGVIDEVAEWAFVNGGVKWGHRGGVKRGHRRLRACPRSPREGPARDAACPQQADAAARAGDPAPTVSTTR